MNKQVVSEWVSSCL